MAGEGSVVAKLTERFEEVLEWSKKALEDKNTRIAVGLGVTAVAAGVAYLLFSSRGESRDDEEAGSSAADGSTASKSAKKNKKRKSAAAKAASAKAKVEMVENAMGTPAAAAPATSLETAMEQAKSFKDQGNELYKRGENEAAAAAYSRGIDLTPSDHPSAAILFANRAACHANLKNNELVVKDCTAALKIDPRYVKAIARRALAYEALGNLEESLYDFTTLNVLEGFSKQEHMAAFDKVLEALAERIANELFATRKPQMPSPFYIAAYLEGFRVHPLDQPTLKEGEAPAKLTDTDGDHQYRTAIHLAKNRHYDESLQMLEASIKNLTAHSSHARNLLGTFLYLRGDLQASFDIFNTLIEADPTDVNALIKRGSVAMELNKPEDALADMEKAMQLNSEQSDVYYHRGNVYFLMDRASSDPQAPPSETSTLPLAIADYNKALELNPEIPFLYVQLAVSLHRSQLTEEALATFERAEKRFPNSADILNYHGEVLLELQQIDEAMSLFDKATRLKPTTPLAHMNKGLALLMHKGDQDKAMTAFRKAIHVDDRCDMVYLQLAQVHQQLQQPTEALENYDKALQLARSTSDMKQILRYREAVKAQITIARRFGAPDL